MDRALFELSPGERIDLCYESMLDKDATIAAHCARVADLVERLCRTLGLPGSTCALLRSAALLHDVGKVAVPSSILAKPAPLDDGEWCIMKQHPVLGERLARKLQLSPALCDLVLHHHEHFDGTGYPGSLRGREIPLSARVLCVVDVFDALTSARCYRRAYDADAALRVMAQESGSTLDPQIFRAFERMLRGDGRPGIHVMLDTG